jgi:hypothetical protein
MHYDKPTRLALSLLEEQGWTNDLGCKTGYFAGAGMSNQTYPSTAPNCSLLPHQANINQEACLLLICCSPLAMKSFFFKRHEGPNGNILYT